MIFLAGCTNATATEYSKPVKFEPEPYCENVDRDADKVIPVETQNILNNEGTEVGLARFVEARLIEAAINVAHASENIESCKNTFKSGEKSFYPFLESKQKEFQKIGGSRLKRNSEIRDVQTNILRLWREDQSARGVYVALQTKDKTGSKYWASRLASAHTANIDGMSQIYIESAMKNFDWIDEKRFGKEVSNHAWLLVQHADRDPEFQSMALKRMEPYLKSRGVSRSNYAFLFDRVAVNTGRKQRYGTQPDWNCVEGQMKLQPLEDPDNVNELRKEMGMDTVEESLAYMNTITCVGDN